MNVRIEQPLAITAMGAISPVGASAPQTCTSIRAGLAGFSEHPFYQSLSRDPEWEMGEPLIAARVPTLDPLLAGPSRLLALAIPALIELGRQAGLRREVLPRSALLLALPEPDEAVDTWALEDIFVPELLRGSALGSLHTVQVNRSGHTGAFELLTEAERLLGAEGLEYCFLLGVDSFVSPERIPVWDEAWRLRSERNADGFIPGEAASALLLELPAHAEAQRAPIAATVTAGALTEEPNPLNSDRSSSGRGLCEALSAVFGSGADPSWVCCDLNGESYRAFEWGLALVRLHEALAGVESLDHPADCHGDVGAATGGLLLSHAAWALSHPHPPADHALLWTTGDGHNRASVRLQGPATA